MIVSGRVQGVFYRDGCRRTASGLGVRGWVRNRGDGTVEVVAEGSRAAVGGLLEWCRQGPSRAHVTGTEVSDETPRGERSFEVRF